MTSHPLALIMLNICQHSGSHFCKGLFWGNHGLAISFYPEQLPVLGANGSSPNSPILWRQVSVTALQWTQSGSMTTSSSLATADGPGMAMGPKPRPIRKAGPSL